jgi:hypothetical protein
VPNPIRARRVERLDIVHENYDATVEHYRRLFGGVVVFDRLQPTWHACLMEVGGVRRPSSSPPSGPGGPSMRERRPGLAKVVPTFAILHGGPHREWRDALAAPTRPRCDVTAPGAAMTGRL